MRTNNKNVKSILGSVYRFLTLGCLYPLYYRFRVKKAGQINRNKVVFLEGRQKKITDSFELLYEDLTKHTDYEVHTQYLQMGFTSRFQYIKLCLAMLADIADAGYVFLNDASDVVSNIPLRKDTVVTQLWHACGAFKRFGMSVANQEFGADKKTMQRFPYHGNYTYVTVSAPEVCWAYQEAMGIADDKTVVATGVSRTDVFFDEKRKQLAKEHLQQALTKTEVFGIKDNRKVLLYAPTFRGNVSKAVSPDDLDIRKLRAKFGDAYILVIKHHPFVKNPPEIPSDCRDFAVDLSQQMRIEDLLMVSDICITDYSSLVFEYSLMERPILFLAPDLDDYFDHRGFYYDYKEFVPGPIVSDTNEVVEYIEHVEERFDRNQLTAFRDKYMKACDGHATERIKKLVFQDGLEEHRK